jgi:hypothetical protein
MFTQEPPNESIQLRQGVFEMRNSLIVVLAVYAASVSLNNGSNVAKTSESAWIARLQATHVSDIESGLPEKPFGDWFSEHTHGAHVRYAIEACDPSAQTESLKKGAFSCVTAIATRGMGSQITMKFLVVTDTDEDKRASPRPFACRFMIGSEGPPPGSPIKVMTKLFHKLSEMAAFLGWQ